MRLLLILVSFTTFLIACSEKEPVTVSSAIRHFAVQPQQFILDKSATRRYVGESGTVLEIDTGIFVFENGEAPGSEITLELTEVFNVSDMIALELPTVSNGQLLESYGMVFLRATAQGKDLRLKEGKVVRVAIPNKRKGQGGQLFYGEPEGSVIDWKLPRNAKDTTETVETLTPMSNGQVHVNRKIYRINAGRRELLSDTTYLSKTPLGDSVRTDSVFEPIPNYYVFEVDRLGWINCDRFVDVVDKTSLTVKVDDHSVPIGYLVFDSIHSIMRVPFGLDGSAKLENLPVNGKVKLVVIDKRDGQLYLSVDSLALSPNKAVLVQPRSITDDELRTSLKALDR